MPIPRRLVDLRQRGGGARVGRPVGDADSGADRQRVDARQRGDRFADHPIDRRDDR